MSSHKDDGSKAIIVIAAIVVGVIAYLAYSREAAAGGFREQGAWQFEDPFKKTARMNREAMRQLYMGGYYSGSHANKSIYIGHVEVDDVNGNIQYSNQENTNIGNYNDIDNGSGTLNVDIGQDLGSQGNSNASDQSRSDSPSTICMNCN